jgi:hypothetical protein
MPLFQKPHKRSKYDAQLIKIIADEHLPVDVVHWMCKGKCYKPWLPDEQSVQKHIRVIFPSGMMWYVCTVCGAGVIFDDAVDRDISVIPDMKERKIAMDDYAIAKASMTEYMR